jgi:hypothetical protein
MTLRNVMECIEGYRSAEEMHYRRAHSLAIMTGQIANMPYMKPSDQRKLMEATRWDSDGEVKEYTDEEVQSLLEGAKELYGEEFTIKKRDGQVISRT